MRTSPVTSAIRAHLRRIHRLEMNIQHYDAQEARESAAAAAGRKHAKPKYWRTLASKNRRNLDQTVDEIQALWHQATDDDVALLLRSRSERVRLKAITLIGAR